MYWSHAVVVFIYHVVVSPPPQVFGDSDDDDMASSTHSGDKDKILPRDEEQDGENNTIIRVS